MDNNFGGFWNEELIGIYPAFDDLNGDGQTDLLVGNEAGNLLYLMNTGSGFAVESDSYFEIDVGDYSTPQLFDIDKDGRTDLLIGEKGGNINYYRNEGTNANPSFIFITDSLGKINVTNPMVSLYGYSTPWFFRDQQQKTKLIVGSEEGIIYYYTNIDDNLDGTFELSDELDALLDTTDLTFDRGLRTAATIGKITNNNGLTMIAGNYSGGLEYFNGAADISPGYIKNPLSEIITIYPNPATNSIRIRSDDMITSISISTITGRVVYQKTNGLLIKEIESIDISTLIKGIYMVKVETKNGRIIKKLVVR
jgi:hypothetical protein